MKKVKPLHPRPLLTATPEPLEQLTRRPTTTTRATTLPTTSPTSSTISQPPGITDGVGPQTWPPGRKERQDWSRSEISTRSQLRRSATWQATSQLLTRKTSGRMTWSTRTRCSKQSIMDCHIFLQDDCSKRLLCELNAKASEGKRLTETEEVLANSFGKRNNLDVGAETLEFDVAAVLGRKVCTSDKENWDIRTFCLCKITLNYQCQACNRINFSLTLFVRSFKSCLCAIIPIIPTPI